MRYLLTDSRLAWLILVGSLLYALLQVDIGWYAPDSGMLGHIASRVLRGEVPHRDFGDPYTGGLSVLHAIAMGLFGESLRSLRWMLWLWHASVVVFSYRLARSVADAVPAAAASGLAGLLAIPQWSEAYPSWYNYFFAVFGSAALLRFHRTGRGRWLLAGGACGGISLLFKITGLYFLVGAWFFLAFITSEPKDRVGRASSRTPWGGILVGVGLLAVMASALGIMVRHLTVERLLVFVVPPAAILGSTAWLIITRRHLAVRRIAARTAVFSIGAALPMALLALAYALDGSLRDLLVGVAVLPYRRVDTTVWPPQALSSLAGAAVIVGPAVLAPLLGRRAQWIGAISAVVVMVTVVAVGGRGALAAQMATGLRVLVPLLALVAARLIVKQPRDAHDDAWHLGLLLSCALSTMNLIQYPWAYYNYVFFVAPLTVFALFVWQRFATRGLGPITVLYAVVFGGWAVVNARDTRMDMTEFVESSRMRITVAPQDANAYRSLVALVDSLDTRGVLYATPDAAHVYYLTGLRNPTGTIYEFLDRDFGAPPDHRLTRVLNMLRDADVGVVVLRSGSVFSGPPNAALLDSLMSLFPTVRRVGDLQVRWAAGRGPAH